MLHTFAVIRQYIVGVRSGNETTNIATVHDPHIYARSSDAIDIDKQSPGKRDKW